MRSVLASIRPGLLGACVLAAIALAPVPALANDYLPGEPGDWFRYQDQDGESVESRVELVEGDWRMWSNFAGLGQTWVATESSNDWFWVWNGAAGDAVADLSGGPGSSGTIQLDCNGSAVRVGSKLASIRVPAGTFTDVTRLSFARSCDDAGLVSVWFAKGVGVVKWSERSPSGLRTYQLSAAQVSGRSFPSSGPTPTSDAALPPAEHEEMESILWGCDDTWLVLDTYKDAFRGLNGSGVKSEVFVATNSVASQLRAELVAANVPLDDVEFLVAPLDSVWIRDYGPIVLKTAKGQRAVADLTYYSDRPNDDRIPSAYANLRGWPVIRVDLELEGGNLATDGRGLALTTRGVEWFNPDLNRTEIEGLFARFGCNRVEFFQPLVDEATTHIDMFARVMDDGRALVSRYPTNHRQRPIVDAAAKKLRDLGYAVARVDTSVSYDEFATYANSVLANGLALVPQYGTPQRDRQARRAYEALGYTVVGIDASLAIKYAGATHCMSMQVPAGK